MTVFVKDEADQEFESVESIYQINGMLCVTCEDGSEARFVAGYWQGYISSPKGSE